MISVYVRGGLTSANLEGLNTSTAEPCIISEACGVPGEFYVLSLPSLLDMLC